MNETTENTNITELPVNIESKPTEADSSIYTHKFVKPFEHEGIVYTELSFDFERLTGRDVMAIENEMQIKNEYALAPEISRNFQAKLAARAAKVGSDVITAFPFKDFNKITNVARDFLLSTGS